MNATTPNRISFALAGYKGKTGPTQDGIFSGEMEQIVHGSRIKEVIEHYYPMRGKRGRPPIKLARMLRVNFVEQWCSQTDEAVEYMVHGSQALSDFM